MNKTIKLLQDQDILFGIPFCLSIPNYCSMFQAILTVISIVCTETNLQSVYLTSFYMI